MPDDVTLTPPNPGICPETTYPLTDKLGRMSVNWGQTCIMERCAKYQACKVLPETMKRAVFLLETLAAR